MMDSNRSRLEQRIFELLDITLPNEVKQKLSSSDSKTIVSAFADMLYTYRTELNLAVLLDPTAKSHAPQKSKFIAEEEPEFLTDLSKL